MEQCIRALIRPLQRPQPLRRALPALDEIFFLMHTRPAPPRAATGWSRPRSNILRHFSYPTLSVADVAPLCGRGPQPALPACSSTAPACPPRSSSWTCALRRAQQLMRETDPDGDGDRLLLRFREPSHFSRLFKRRTRPVSPGLHPVGARIKKWHKIELTSCSSR